MAGDQTHQDVELGRVRDGYPALASWIARDPDNESFVFRKFDRLSARNLLHLQSQLIQLEHELDELDEAARLSTDFEARQSSRRWETFAKLAGDENRPERKRLDKAKELEVKIKDYHEALLRQSRIIELNGPSTRVLSTFRDYVSGQAWKSSGLPAAPIISGRAKDMLDEEIDLIALSRSADEDFVSRFLRDHWAFQKRATVDPLDQTTIYKGQHVVWTVATISMFCAIVLLVVAMMSLYVVNSPRAKLGMVAAYTVLFGVSLALLTNARRAEVYGAAAAYAAVLVVFISGSVGGFQNEQCLVQLPGGYFKAVSCPS